LLLALAGSIPIVAILGFWFLIPPLLMSFFAAGLILAVTRGGQGKRVRRGNTAGDGGSSDGGYHSHCSRNGSSCGASGNDGGDGGGGSSD
jgi:hypothetical protein